MDASVTPQDPAPEPRAGSIVLRGPEPRAVRDAVLVLHAMSIPCDLVRAGSEYLAIVPEDLEVPARRQLVSYLRENQLAGLETSPFEARSDGLAGAMYYLSLVLVFFLVQSARPLGLDYQGLGLLDAGLVRSGEIWRTFTALFLHADVAHLFGNALFGVVFGVILAQSTGSGLAWLAILLGGALGGVMNSFVHDVTHRSIGASTAVFAALGLVVGVEVARRKRNRGRWGRALAPIVLGLVLLGWFGVGGGETGGDRNVDVMAHALGFVAGILLAPGLHFAADRAGPRTQVRAALTALGLVLGAWALAVL